MKRPRFKDFITYQHLTEAISDRDLSRALLLIMNVIERKLNSNKTPLQRLPGLDRFKNAKGAGFGIRWFCKDLSSFRFNFAKNKLNSNEVDSIDIFTPQKGMTPVARIETRGISLARILPFIAGQINNPKPGKYNVDIFEEEVIQFNDSTDLVTMCEGIEIEIDGVKYATKGDARKALREKGFKGRQMENMLMQPVIVTSGMPEVNNTDASKAEAELAKVDIDPNEVLDVHIPTFTQAVAKGIKHTLIVAGTPGIGKSFGVDGALAKLFGPENGGKNKNWAIYKGKVSLTEVYKTLFFHNGKTIVFDDADSVFASEDATNLLKAALDTKAQRFISYKVKAPEFFDPHNPPFVYDNTVLFPSYAKSLKLAENMYRKENQVRGALEPDEKANIEMELNQPKEVRYRQCVNLGKIPNIFEFTGSCIFISNRKLSQIDSAIRDRSIAPIELDMTRAEVIDRIEKILPHLTPGDDGDNIKDLPMSEKQIVLDYFREIMLKHNRQNISLRTFKTAMTYYTMDKTTWKRLVEIYVGI